MKKLPAIIFFLFIIFSSVAASADSGDQDTGGGILDYLSVTGLSCGSSASSAMPCSEDATAGLFASIACKVMKAFSTGTIPVYCGIVTNPDFLAAIDAAMMLYVIFMGISFMFGLMPMRAGAVLGKILKAMIIYSIVINSDLYLSLVYTTVIKTPQDIVQILLSSDTGSGSGSGSQNFFQYVDQGMSKVMQEVYQSQASTDSGTTYAKANLKVFMIGMAIWQLGGDHVGGIFFSVIIGWILAYFSIMVRYLLAMLSLMFVLMLGPLFIPMLLFEKTKYIFEEWLFMILCFIMQIVLVVAFVLMVQHFFIDLYNLIQNGLTQGSVPPSSKEHLVDFNNTANSNGSYRLTATNGKITPQAAEQYFNQVFSGKTLPEVVVALIEKIAIITASIAFIKYVPALGALLVGRAQFIRIFQGESFGFKRDKEYQANLLGQGSGGPQIPGAGDYSGNQDMRAALGR